MFNPHSLIAARLLDRDPAAEIDTAWMFRRLETALALRSRIMEGTFYRLVHAEADGLPGLIVDRYDDVAVVQANTAGMDRLMPLIVSGLRALLPLRAVVARNDAAARQQEGMAADVRLLFGDDASSVVEEGGVRFSVDPLGGQKTGWFFDQRFNRDRVAALASGARVLDVCCHVGAFGGGGGFGDFGGFVGAGFGAGAGYRFGQRVRGCRDLAARGRVRRARSVGRDAGAVRYRHLRSARLREIPQRRRGRVTGLRADGSAGGDGGGTERVSVHGFMQPSCPGRFLGGADRGWVVSGAARRADFV